MRNLAWTALPVLAAALGGCMPQASLHFSPYDSSGGPAGALLKVDFQECYSETRGMALRVVCRQQTTRTTDPITGQPLETPYTEELLGGLEIGISGRESWEGIRPILSARFQYVRSDGAGWVCGTQTGHVQFGGVAGITTRKLGIRFGLHCDRIGPPAPEPDWAYREVSGLLTCEDNPVKVAQWWPKIFRGDR